MAAGSTGRSSAADLQRAAEQASKEPQIATESLGSPLGTGPAVGRGSSLEVVEKSSSEPSQAELWAKWSERREKKKQQVRERKNMDSKMGRLEQIRSLHSKTGSHGSQERRRGPYDSNDGASMASSGRSRMSGSSIRSLDRGFFQLSTNVAAQERESEEPPPAEEPGPPAEAQSGGRAAAGGSWGGEEREEAPPNRRCWGKPSSEGGAGSPASTQAPLARQDLL